MKKLSLILSRKSLLTICKSYVRPNLDYTDIIYDKPSTESFIRKIEMVQYKAALIITGAFKGTLHHKIIKSSVQDLLQIEDRLENVFFTK